MAAGPSAQQQRMMGRPMGGGAMMAGSSPAMFNRLARLMRQKIGSIPYQSGVSSLMLPLPQVGFHYRLGISSDIDCGTTAGSGLTARWLSGHFGGNTSRFPAPLGLIKRMAYTLNVSSAIYSTDGYGNYVTGLVSNQGMDPFIQVASSMIGRNRKEREAFCIYNATTGALAKPDDALAASTNYKLRSSYYIPLTLGEAATAGLIPCQDIRINPQVFLDFGAAADVVSVTADLPAMTGNFDVTLDYFTVPDPSIAPDTDFTMQTTMDLSQVAGTGDQTYRPQIGGVILRTLASVWNAGKAVDTVTVVDRRLRVQQAVSLEYISPDTQIIDERRWYGKLVPDEVYCWDHTTGLGDPGMPSLRDRIASNQLTSLEYILNWNSATTPSGVAEVRYYKQQLIPLPRAQ